MKSIFEEMGGTYTLGTDGMYYPDLVYLKRKKCIMGSMVRFVNNT